MYDVARHAGDVDFGTPTAACRETSPGSGVFLRDWSKATVRWDCATGHANITMKPGFEQELVHPPLKGKAAWTQAAISS